jgi:hypothetical protein
MSELPSCTRDALAGVYDPSARTRGILHGITLDEAKARVGTKS